MENFEFEDQVSVTVDDDEVLVAESETEESSPNLERLRDFTGNGLVREEEGSSAYDVIKKSFLLGMGRFGKETNVIAIHKNLCFSSTGQARARTFRLFTAAVAEKSGGNANVKYAWYGASRDEICDIMAHGFSQCQKPENSEKFGIGIHLSSAKYSIDSALSSIADENGLHHLILCRVIMGKMEVIPAGSNQFHPSSKEFDSGVDNFSDPRKYIVWSAFMNSHIFPTYIVSFESPNLMDFRRMHMNMVRPKSAWMSFPTLLSILSKSLHHSQMAVIARCYKDFKGRQIRRQQLIQKMREIAGDKLLAAVIKHYRNKQLEPITGSSSSRC